MGDGMNLLPLSQLARVIRSKNAGPLCLTVDLFFPIGLPSSARVTARA